MNMQASLADVAKFGPRHQGSSRCGLPVEMSCHALKVYCGEWHLSVLALSGTFQYWPYVALISIGLK